MFSSLAVGEWLKGRKLQNLTSEARWDLWLAEQIAPHPWIVMEQAAPCWALSSLHSLSSCTPSSLSSRKIHPPVAHGQHSSLPELGVHLVFSLAGSALGAPHGDPSQPQPLLMHVACAHPSCPTFGPSPFLGPLHSSPLQHPVSKVRLPFSALILQLGIFHLAFSRPGHL